MAGAAIAAVANLVLVAAVTRGFPAATAGTFFAVTSAFLLVAVLARLGTTTGLVYFISRARALDRLHEVPAVLRAGLAPVAVFSVACGAALFLLAPDVAALTVGSRQEEFTALLRSIAPLLPAAVLTEVLLAATRGFGSMSATVRIEKIGRSLLQLVLVTAAASWAAVAWLGTAWAAPYVVAAVMAARSLRAAARRAATTSAPLSRTPGRPAPAIARPFWAFTWARAVSSLAQAALQRLDILVVAALRGPAEAAVYTAATRFLVAGQLGASSISSAAQPQLGEALARGDRALANRLYRTATAWLMLVTWPLYLLAALFAPLLMRLFGDGYSAGTPVVVILSLVMLLATGCGMVDMVLTMGGRTSWNLVNTLVALAVNIALNLLLVPHWGIVGAATAWAGAILVNNLLPLAQIGWALGLHPFDAATRRAAVVGLTSFGALPGAVLLAGVPTVVALPLSMILGVPLYAWLCWRSREVLQLRSLSSLRRHRGRQRAGGGGGALV